MWWSLAVLRFTVVALVCWCPSVQSDVTVSAASKISSNPPALEEHVQKVAAEEPIVFSNEASESEPEKIGFPKASKDKNSLPIVKSAAAAKRVKDRFAHTKETGAKSSGGAKEIEDNSKTSSKKRAPTSQAKGSFETSSRGSRSASWHRRPSKAPLRQQVRTPSDEAALAILESGVLNPTVNDTNLDNVKRRFNDPNFKKYLSQNLEQGAQIAKSRIDAGVQVMQHVQDVHDLFVNFYEQEKLEFIQASRDQQFMQAPGGVRSPHMQTEPMYDLGRGSPYMQSQLYDDDELYERSRTRGFWNTVLSSIWFGAAGLIASVLVMMLIQQKKKNEGVSQISLVDV